MALQETSAFYRRDPAANDFGCLECDKVVTRIQAPFGESPCCILRLMSPLSTSCLGRISGYTIISSLFNTIRCNRLLGPSLQPLEFLNRPIKDIAVLESLLVEKVVEHLSKESIVRSIFVPHVVGWKIAARLTYAGRPLHLQNTQIFGLAGGNFETWPGGFSAREVFE